MRKILVLILTVAMCAVCALAEPAQGFVFRNGITWGMTYADASAAEGRECDYVHQFDGGCSLAYYTAVTVSRYTADMGFIFWDDALRLTVYDFIYLGIADENGDDPFAYLLGAMESSYGAPAAADPVDAAAVINHVSEGLYAPEELTDVYEWNLADTVIYMLRYPNDSFCIVYTDAAFFEDVVGFNTSGL